MYQRGLGTAETEAKITYYPQCPGNSTFYPETKELQIAAFAQLFGQEFADITFGGAQVISVPVDRLSHFLRNKHHDVQVIDLLLTNRYMTSREREVLMDLSNILNSIES